MIPTGNAAQALENSIPKAPFSLICAAGKMGVEKASYLLS